MTGADCDAHAETAILIFRRFATRAPWPGQIQGGPGQRDSSHLGHASLRPDATAARS
jgi:hypothetical protein